MDSENVAVKAEVKTDSEYSTPDDSGSDYEPENDSRTPIKKRRSRSCASRLVHKLNRMKGSPRKRARRNARERENYRRRIANETPEQREIRLQKLRELHRKKMQRLREAPKEITRQHAIQRERYRRRMANETPEEKEKRLQKLRNLHIRKMQRLKEAETPEEKAKRHARQRERYKRKIANETPEEREIRLQKLRELHSRRTQRLRVDETPEEREERERVHADVRQLIATCETDEQRRARRRGHAADWIGVIRRKKRHPLTVNLQDHDFHCELCSTTIIMRFRYISHLHHHINKTGLVLDIHEPIVLYICDFTGCHLCFRDKGRYVGHLESHSSTRSTFNCSVCRKPFSMETNCEKHVELAHGADAADYVDCEYCHLVVKKEDGETHFATHQIRLDAQEASHICETCGKGFKQLSTMKTHIRVVHTQPKPVDRTPRTKRSEMILKKQYNAQPCVVCGKLLLNKMSLDQHMLRNHTYEHGTECFECGKRLRYHHTLHSHIRRWHRNEPLLHKRAKCKFCPRDFSSYFLKNKHHFIDHRGEYLRERAFCCGVCFRNFAGKDIFMNHLLVHERFKCPVCFLRSVSISMHDEHISSHNIGPLAPTRTRKRHRNVQIKKSRKKRPPVTINTIFVDQSEKGIIEGTNHYFHRDDGWHVIPSDLSIKLSHNSIEQGEAQVADTVEPEANEDHKIYYYEQSEQPDPSAPQSAGFGVRLQNIPVPGTSHQFLEDFQRTIPESQQQAESQSETATQAEYQKNPTASTSTEKPKKYKCDRCPLQFNYPKYLLIHIAWHVGNETKNVEVVATPAVAVQTVLSKNPTELELAKYRNPGYEEPEHTGVVAKRYVCPECAQLFHHLPKLNDHRRNKHGVYAEPALNLQPISCEFCTSTFTRQHFLRRHNQLVHHSAIIAKNTEDNSIFSEEYPWTPVGQDSGESKSASDDTPSEKETGHRKQTKSLMKRSTGKSRRTAALAKPFPKASVSRAGSSKLQDKWKCGECPMAFIQEATFKQHQLTHTVARVTNDFEKPEWIIPDIKMEPQDADDQDPDWQNDAIAIPAYKSDEENSEENTEDAQPSVRPSTLQQLKMRTTRSMSKLAPHLKQAAESFPQRVIVPLPRLEFPQPGFLQKIKIEAEEDSQATPTKRTVNSIRRSVKKKRESNPRKPRKPSFKLTSPLSKSEESSPQPKRTARKPREVISKSTSLLSTESEESSPKTKRSYTKGRKAKEVCEVCGKVLHPNTPLEAHLATHSKVKPFKCDLCDRVFGHEKYLKNHRYRFHKEVVPTEKNTCPICDKVIKTPSLFEAHIATHSGVYPFQCDICRKKYSHEQLLKGHKQRYHPNVPYPKKSQKGRTLIKKPGFEYMCSEYYCDICYKTIKSKSRFDRHMRSHFDVHPELETTIYMYHCDACPQAFRVHAQFLSHLMTHSITESNTASLVCTICNKAFAQLNALESHTKNVHESLDTIFDCVFCHRSFKTEDDWKIHEKAHAVDLAASLDGSHMCAHCGQTFSVLPYLNAHILKVHDGEGLDPSFQFKSFVGKKQNRDNEFAPCQVCGEKFGIRKGLPNHLLMEHTYEHGLICFVCSKTFTRLAHLNRHLREFHNDNENLAIHSLRKVRNSSGKRKTYSCPYCPVTYSGGTLGLNKHLFRVHHEEYMQGKPVYCRLCFKNFVTDEELEAHRSAHDGIKCKTCGDQFLKMSFLSAHIVRCSGEKEPHPSKSPTTSSRATYLGKNNSVRNLSSQLDPERYSTDSSEDEDYAYEDRPTYELMGVQPVATHSLGQVEHPLPLNLVHPSPWLSLQPSEQVQFTVESESYLPK